MKKKKRKKGKKKKKVSGLPIVRGGIHLRNYDNLLFCRVDATEWGYIQHLLTTYEKASSQTINLGKPSIFFSRNTKSIFYL